MEESLERFVAVQEAIYPQALAELRRGRKESHWMWFIFPQIAGLGMTEMSQRYAIRSADEAARYLAHPLLGSRLVKCTAAVLSHSGKGAERIFGGVDAMKFRSSLTLFAIVAGQAQPIFQEALAAFYGGEQDPRTLALLA